MKKEKAVRSEAQSKDIPIRSLYWLCGIFGILLYINTIGHEFTVDDGTVIQNNRFTVQGISGIDDIFSNSYRAGFWDRKEGLYRPLSVALFALEWELAPENPLPGHLMNILLYGITSAILFSVLRRMLQNQHPFVPLLIALLWIAHPLHTEVVANIKSSDELMGFLLGLISLKLLFNYHDKGRITLIIFSVISFLLALLCKENAVTWAGVFPLALWCFTSADIKKVLSYTWVFFALIGLYFLLRIMVIGEIGGGYELMLINNSITGANSLSSQLASAFLIMGKYLGLFLFPKDLSFDYSYNSIANTSFADPSALFPFVLIVAGFIYAIKKLSERSLNSFAILFYLGTIALVSNIFFLIEATMAERFLFTPSLGLCILLCSQLERFIKNDKFSPGKITLKNLTGHSLFVPALSVLLLFSGRTISRNFDWENNLTLLQHDVKVSPESARIRYALGSAFLIEKALKEPEGSSQKNGYLDRAIAELNKGVGILPNYNEAWYHLGVAYKEKGDAPQAVFALEKARSYKPFTDAAHLTASGLAYGLNGQFDKAIPDLKEACKLVPDDADYWNNYGLYLAEAGQHSASLEALDKAISLRKNFEKAYYNKGNAYAKAGDFRAALGEYNKALNISPNHTDALNNSGNCYIMLQRTDSALVFFKRAYNAGPDNAKAVVNLAVTLQSSGDTAEARIYFEKAKAMGVKL